MAGKEVRFVADAYYATRHEDTGSGGPRHWTKVNGQLHAPDRFPWEIVTGTHLIEGPRTGLDAACRRKNKK